jgi:carbon-monoxide dehydrogenase medium subunit
MIPASFDYLTAKTLDEALRLLASHGEDAKLLAGGQSLLPLLKLRLATPKLLIDLGKISGLSDIGLKDGKVIIGALATHYQIECSTLLKKYCPLLPQTASAIGDLQVRNRGTIGGSLSHADPSADWPAAILALGGELKLNGLNGVRWLSAENFFLGPMTTALEPTEILTEIRLPQIPPRGRTVYLKMAQQASGFAIVGVALWLQTDKSGRCVDIGIGVTGLDAKPFRAHTLERRLRGKKLSNKLIQESAAQVARGIDPLEDLHASADYRAHLARILTVRAIQQTAAIPAR